MNLSEKTIGELKILAYDEMMKANVAQQNLQLLNIEISKRPVAPADDDESEA